MLRCSMCGVEKPEDDFAFRSLSTRARQGHCRACHAVYRREHYLRNRDAYIAREVARIDSYRAQNRVLIREYLRTHPCVECGETDLVLLEFDHRDRATKTDAVSLIAVQKPWRRVLAEIAKCDVRCVVCHRRRTAIQLNWRRPSEVPPAPVKTAPGTEQSTETRGCTGCGAVKPATAFSIKTKITGRRTTRCLTCIAAASREHYRRNRANHLARKKTPWVSPQRGYHLEFLSTHPCVDCGETDPMLLEFDHRTGDTKVDAVSRLVWERKWSAVRTEIAKCDVRCVRCHRLKTAREFGWSKLGEDRMLYSYAGVL